MPPQTHKRFGEVQANCVETLQTWAKAHKTTGPMYDLLYLVCDCLDYAVDNSDTWCTIGLTRNHDAFMITARYAGERVFVTGANLQELAKGCSKVFETT